MYNISEVSFLVLCSIDQLIKMINCFNNYAKAISQKGLNLWPVPGEEWRTMLTTCLPEGIICKNKRHLETTELLQPPFRRSRGKQINNIQVMVDTLTGMK